MEFRGLVREFVLGDVAAAPLDLIRDLFRAETRCSREAWEIADGVGALAEALLRRGGENCLDDYLDGKFQGWDAHLGSVFTADLSLARALLAATRERLARTPASPLANLWRKGEEFSPGG